MFAMTGPLQNRRHEIFAVELATGGPLEASYVKAGFKPGRAARFNASRLRNKPHLRQRVQELLAEAAKDAVVGIGWVQLELIRIIMGEAESRSGIRDGKPFKETDRQGALIALARTLGVSETSINVTAAAAAAAAGNAGRTDADRAAALIALMAKIKAKREAA